MMEDRKASTTNSMGASVAQMGGSRNRRGSYMDAMVAKPPKRNTGNSLMSLSEEEEEGAETPPPKANHAGPSTSNSTPMNIVDVSPSGMNGTPAAEERSRTPTKWTAKWKEAKNHVVEEWRKTNPKKTMAQSLTQVVKEAKVKDEEMKRAGETREDRLKTFLTQDKDVEKLLLRIRKEDSERERREEKQKQWEQTSRLSKRTIVLPDSKVKRYWELYVLLMVVSSLVLVPMDIAFQVRRAEPRAVLGERVW